MQIACPQCAMQYVLDERLLPPGGAPVQCTRCSHVFTAVPGGPQRPTTQVFGAVPEQGRTGTPAAGSKAEAGSVRNATQVFGGGAASLRSTQVFGGQAPAEGAPPPETPPRASTQVFGSAPPGSPTPPRAGTQVFGSAPADAPAPQRASTQVFGSPPAESPAPPRASTQVFGSPPAQSAPPSASTQVFGRAAAPSGEAPARASTQVFGSAAPPPGEAPPRASTQVFGSAAPPPGEAAPRASTQVFGVPAAAPPRASTQVFGSAPAAPPRASTQVFGTPVTPTPPQGEAPTAGVPRTSTQVFGAPLAADAPPGAAAPARAQRVDLPPELLAERGARPEASRTQPASRRTGLWLVLLAALLALLAFLAWRTVQRRGPSFPLEAVSARDSAASLLRRDDARSRQQALAELEQVLKAHPDFLEARAELVVALALELDDLKVEQALRRQEARAAQRERESLESARAPAGWEKQAVQLRSVQAAKQGAAEQLEPRVKQLTARAEAALRQLEPEGGRTATAGEQRARVRAQALLGAVQGAPGSMARAEQLRADGNGQGWDVIAEAEYVLNAPASSLGPTARNDSVRALEALRQRDAAFLRAYVLGARLALAAGERRSAAALLDMAVALNPTHEVARTLQALARSEGTARDVAP